MEAEREKMQNVLVIAENPNAQMMTNSSYSVCSITNLIQILLQRV